MIVDTHNREVTTRETGRPITQRVPGWLLAATSSSVVNLILYVIASSAGFIDAGKPQEQVTPVMVVLGSVVGAVGAAGVHALVRRTSQNPNRTFRVVATVVLVISLATPLTISGASAALVVMLMFMHMVVWAISLGALTTHERESWATTAGRRA